MTDCACHHCHNEHSALDGWATIDEIIARTQEIGYPSVTLTNHGNVAGHLELGYKCEKAGIKPIFGIEAYHGELTDFKGTQRDQDHLIIGAYNDTGLKNLWRLSDRAASNFRFVPRVTFEMLKELKEGLWATSACIQGKVSQGIENGDNDDLNRYLEIFGENFFIEIHTYPSERQKIVNQSLVQLARERGLPMIWSSDAHFASPSDFESHDTYLLMQMGDEKGIDTPIEERKMYHPKALYIKAEDEIREDLAYLGNGVVDECINNSFELSEMCYAKLPEIKRHLPVFVPSDSKLVRAEYKEYDAGDLLTSLVVQGAYERYGDEPSQAVWDRLGTELDVFLNAGLEHYILQVWEICEFCRASDIVKGPGRGSASGSLVCYVLKITDIDSLYYKLPFERFYNAGREKGLPDIDIDFPVAARAKVKEFVANRWGVDKVENIGTIIRLKPIAALNRTWNVFNVDPKEFGTIRKIVGKTPDINILGSDSIGWENDGGDKTIYVMDEVGDQIEEYIGSLPEERQSIIRRWLSFVGKVTGKVSSYGIHPSGVVVSDTPISEELPRMWSAGSKVYGTQFPMNDVAKRLFLKDDLLGIRNLDTIADWEEQMAAKGVTIDWAGLERKDHPEEMWQLLDRGLGTGIFQIEDSPFPLELCKRMKPRSLEDLSLIGALNRPGPIRAGSYNRYIERRNGNEAVTYDHPLLEDVLDETLGEWIYQESIIYLFNRLGYTLQEADGVRSLLGKKDPEEQRRLYEGKGQWKGRGYLEMAKKAGLDNAQFIWDKIAGFSKYSFNKSHSVSYAFITFRTLFCKYWGPEEFILACIRTNPEDIHKYIAEGKRMEVNISPPHIAHSEGQIGIKDGQIYLGFSEVKGLSNSSSKYLLQLRKKYGHQIYEPDVLKERLEAENLVWHSTKPEYRSKVSPRTILKMNQIDLLVEIGAFDDYIERPVTDSERRATEKKLLGIVISQNSEEIWKNNVDRLAECDSYTDLEEYGKATLPGTIVSVEMTKTKANQEDMAIVSMEYRGESVKFAVFPRQFNTYKYMLKEGNSAIMSLKTTERGSMLESGSRLS